MSVIKRKIYQNLPKNISINLCKCLFQRLKIKFLKKFNLLIYKIYQHTQNFDKLILKRFFKFEIDI